ncbi:transposase, partial [Paenibacillus sp. SI8]|uniref:IS110 family transposase n=1 Tax=unclassified Paenibacillus TaxID=185978 RepID=UPI003465375A
MIKKYLFVGIDMHKKTHTAVFVDWLGNKCGELCFSNKPSAYPDLLAEVKKHIKKGVRPIFGLEDTGNWGRALAVYLTEQKQTVKEVNGRLSSERRKSRPIVQKSDSWDAECIAKVLRDEHERLPDIQPMDLFWTINQLFTVRKGLLKNMTAMVNRLHHLIYSHYPSYRTWFANVDNTTALAFWETYPSPSCLKGVTLEQLTEFLVTWSQKKYTQEKAEQILSDVAKDGDTTTGFQGQRDHMIGVLVRNLRFYRLEISGMEKQLKPLVQSLGFQLETLTGMEFLSACAFISEIGNIHRFPTPQKLAMYAGIAP